MATDYVNYYRNYNINDNFYDMNYKLIDPAPSITNCEDFKSGDKGWENHPMNFTFKEWNTARDGSGISIQVGETNTNYLETSKRYAIWEETSTMPTISKITLPNGNTYDIKDTWAREQISAITGGSAIVFKGVSSTELTDGGNQNPTVDGTAVTTKVVGDLYFYGDEEFIYGDDNKWHSLGEPLSSLGALAKKDSATASYQPAGTISTPTFTGSSSNVTITTASSSSGNYTPSGTISKPTFTGSSMTSTGNYTPQGSVAVTSTAVSKNITINASTDTAAPATYTPAGSVTVTTNSTSNKTAAVTTASGTSTYTPAGSVTVTTNATTNKTATVSGTTGTATYTPAGDVSAPTISVKTAGSTTAISNPTKVTVAKTVVAAAPGATAPTNNITYYSVSDETLSLYQLGYTTGDSITTASVTVKTGDAAYQASEPEFTGTGTRLVTGNIAVPNTYTATFSGTGARLVTGNIPVPDSYTATFTGTGVALGGTYTDSTVETASFDGTTATISVTGTTTGSVASPSFTGTKVQISGSTTASGTISAPTFTGTTATITVS